MPPLCNPPDDLAALVGTTADALGIDAGFVEKDFWGHRSPSRRHHTCSSLSKGQRSTPGAYDLQERHEASLGMAGIQAGVPTGV
jgi:hypothetical protein